MSISKAQLDRLNAMLQHLGEVAICGVDDESDSRADLEDLARRLIDMTTGPATEPVIAPVTLPPLPSVCPYCGK